MILTPKQLGEARKYISKCVAQAHANGRLPSLRTMLEESHCSRMALQKIIDEYVDLGYLTRKAKSGYYLPSVSSGGATIELVACHDEGYLAHGFLYECMLSMISLFSTHGYSVRVTSINQQDTIDKYLEVSKRVDTAAFVLLAPHTREIISTFQWTGKPVLSLFSQGRFIGVNQLVDSSQLVATQMKHLMELGHRRILYLREEYKQYQSLTETNRALDYYRIMARNGIQVPEHWHTSHPFGKLNETLELAFSKEPTPTALIVGDFAVPGTYDFLRKHNLSIGKDVSVVATDGIAFLSSISPTVSTCVVNSARVSEMAWELLEKQFNGNKGFECREVEIEFRKGESSGKAR